MAKAKNNAQVTVGCELDKVYAAFQFDVTLKKGEVVTSDLSIDVNSVKKAFESNHELECSYNATDKKYTFVLASLKNADIPSSLTSLVSFDITSGGDLNAGDVYTATISNILFTTADEVGYNANNVSFNITIDESDILLDETYTTTTALISATNSLVKVKRTIKSGSWSTICLPFAMTGDQVKDSFGNDVTLGDFCGYETSEDDDENIVGLVVKFNDVDINSGMEANHPYIIKVSSDINEFVVNKVDIVPEEEPTVAAVKRTKKQWSEFIGTYKANTIIEDDMLFISDGKFYYSTGKTKMKAFRAYFDFYDVLTEVEEGTSAARGITMSLGGINNGNGNGEGSGNGEGNGNGNGEGNGEGGTTGIDNVDSQTTATGRVYTLSGQYKGDASQMESLPKGIYIVDGKKVVK